MRNTLLLAGFLLGCLGVGAAATWKQDAPQTPAPTADRSEDLKAIQQRNVEFGTAYNKGDAKALAALFTTEAEVMDEEDNLFQGQETIEKAFTKYFEQNKNAKIEAKIDAYRFIGKDTAVEDGTATVTFPDKGTTTRTKFTNILVRQEGKWFLASVRELEDDTQTPHDRLRALEWMIGEWVDESKESLVTTTCRWSEDKNYILRDYTVHVQGKKVSSGTSRIGWDAQTNRIKAWLFDIDGGHGESFWIQDGPRWIVKGNSVAADGTVGSATYVFTPADRDKIIVSVLDRINGSTLEKDLELTLTRKAPAPGK